MKFYTTSKISENISQTPEGFLVCLGVSIARTGEMVYGAGEAPIKPGPDGKVIISREAAEVFRPETIASFEGKAVTVMHPEDFVNPENWKTLAKGVLQNVRRGKGAEENDLVADLLITDKTAIELVKEGLREVSCGYEAEYFETGVGRGVQKNIIGNHLALVDEGRAGSTYAINDRNGKGSQMKMSEKIKAIFAKAQDEAIRIATGDAKEDDKDKAKDEGSMGAGYDAVMKAVKDLGAQVASLVGKNKDASTEPTESAPAKIEAKDDEEASSLEARLARLEAAVAKLVEAKAEPVGDEGEEVVEDAEGEEEVEDAEGDEEVEDEDLVTDEACDSASRVEILAPGSKFQGKDAKAKALRAAYATKDGKAVIHQFTGGKAPNFKDDKFIDAVFVGASEVLKTKRSADFSQVKTRTKDSESGKGSQPMTAEALNEINAKHYAVKK